MALRPLPLLLAGALWAGGCAHGPRAPDLTPAQPRWEQLATEVSQLRGMAWRHAPRFAVDETVPAAAEIVDVDAVQAFWRSTGVTGPVAPVTGVPDEPVAFFDARFDVVRLHTPPGVSGPDMDALLVRALGSALCAQYRSAPATGHPLLDDHAAAARGWSGAQGLLTLLAWWVERGGRGGLEDAVARLLDAPATALWGGTEFSVVVRALSPPAREAALLLDQAALRLAAQLHQRGGFPLLNRACAAPPLTTAQVLHPEHYLAGRPAVPVKAPAPPPRFAVLSTGSAGAAGYRAFLGACHPEHLAAELADGWAGDRWRRTRAPDGRTALEWTLVFERERHARMSQFILEKTRACLKDRGDGDLAVARDNRVVLFTRALPPPAVAAVQKHWLAAAGDPPAAVPPFPDNAMAAAAATRGRVENGWFVYPALGLRAPIPAGFHARTGAAGVDLLISADDVTQPGVATLAFLPAVLDPLQQAAFMDVMRLRAAQEHGHPWQRVDAGPVELTPGIALHHAYLSPDGNRTLDGYLLPWCGGRGLLFITVVATAPVPRRVLRAWPDALVLDGTCAPQ